MVNGDQQSVVRSAACSHPSKIAHGIRSKTTTTSTQATWIVDRRCARASTSEKGQGSGKDASTPAGAVGSRESGGQSEAQELVDQRSQRAKNKDESRDGWVKEESSKLSDNGGVRLHEAGFA